MSSESRSELLVPHDSNVSHADIVTIPARLPSCSSSSTDLFVEPFVADNLEICVSEKLFEGSQVSIEDATVLTDILCSRYNFSDESSSAFHSLIKALLPDGNKFP